MVNLDRNSTAVANYSEKRRSSLFKEITDWLQSETAEKLCKDSFRQIFQDEAFLKKLFHLFDQDGDELLKQDEWIDFLKSRLTSGADLAFGFKFVEIQWQFRQFWIKPMNNALYVHFNHERNSEFIGQIESVAYVLCGDEPINLTTFRQIFQANTVTEKLFLLIDQDNIGHVTTNQLLGFIISISYQRSGSGLDERHLKWLERIFKQTVGNEREIRREEFKNIVMSKNPFFTERVFQIFDKDNSGTISLQEFLDAMHQFAGKTPDDKIKFLFKVYDIDGDGLIQHKELEHVMRACMIENGMKFSEEQIEDLTLALFEDADQGNRGTITFEALKKQLEKHEGLLENLSISIDRWMVPPKPEPEQKSLLKKILSYQPYQLTKPYMKNNYVFLTFLTVFTFINVALFISRVYQYRHHNGYVILARACGQCLNFDCTFILVLMLRQCITFLRTRRFNSVLPLDHHIYLHKLTGVLIGIFGAVHTFMHLLNFGMVVIKDEHLNSANYTMSEWLLTSRPKLFGLVAGTANPTGVILVIILTIMIVCSMPFVRRGGCFEIFYWTHLLYIPFWILMVFHGPNFWKWFVVPGTIYVIERIHRLVWLRSQRGKTYISSGLLLPSKVTHLVIKRPPHLDFRPGDYVFVNIPVIARYEWHPFTISSAPEEENYMWLHIRGVGEWTNTLYSYFEKEQMKLHRGDVLPVESYARGKLMPCQKARTASKKKPKLEPLENQVTGAIDNLSFEPDDSKSSSMNSVASAPAARNGRTSPEPSVHKGQDQNLRKLVLTSKMPLEKSFSMPDMQTRSKNRQRLLALRDYARSESERSFDECQIRRARLKSLGLAYLSPQNKSLAQSFRFMRNKPTIIAFKTPSLEDCDYELPSSSKSATTASNGIPSIPEAIVEEGKADKVEEDKNENNIIQIKLGNNSDEIVNYPVGKALEIYLDGPYGAPSSHIFQAQHAVLIATGIGVTPFASILQSIMYRYWKARHTCPKCAFSWASEIPPTVMHLRKVDFFWINRDQRSFEWFVNLLSQLEMEQAELGVTMERFLEMHMYITSALQKNDMKAVGLQLALDLLHEKEKRDLITGLKTRTNAGRPNWDKVFKQLQDRKKGKITVFFCGPPRLAKLLRYKCDQFGFNFRKESF